VVITNPVDAMAMVCKKYSKADFVIGTGTNLESLRFRSYLSRKLSAPVSKIQGWVGGEHGQSMVPLWSTTRIYGKPIEDYTIERENVGTYLAEIGDNIVDNIGATEYGPAASFRDIVRGIVNNTDEILSVDIPMEFSSLSELTYVSIPVRMGWTLGPTLYGFLNDIEKQRLENAAIMIHQIYVDAINSLRDA